MDTNPGPQPGPLDGSLSIAEAAAFYGVSEKKIRKRIKDGTLRAVQRPAGETVEWRVETGPPAAQPGPPEPEPIPAPGAAVEQDPTPASAAAAAPTVPPPAPVGWDPALLKVLDILERSNEQHAAQVERLHSEQARLQEENKQLYGQVAMYQAQLAVAEERFRMLEARPAEQTETALASRPDPVARDRTWWRRWLRRF